MVGLVDLAELILGVGVGGLVGMILEDEVAIPPLEVRRRRRGCDTEDGVCARLRALRRRGGARCVFVVIRFPPAAVVPTTSIVGGEASGVVAVSLEEGAFFVVGEGEGVLVALLGALAEGVEFGLGVGIGFDAGVVAVGEVVGVLVRGGLVVPRGSEAAGASEADLGIEGLGVDGVEAGPSGGGVVARLFEGGREVRGEGWEVRVEGRGRAVGFRGGGEVALAEGLVGAMLEVAKVGPGPRAFVDPVARRGERRLPVGEQGVDAREVVVADGLEDGAGDLAVEGPGPAPEFWVYEVSRVLEEFERFRPVA
mmetsp:Transcript_22347/g.72050  ORF Transcript_22347/g.72050 Transcript_22347/m.72050 type:complete len:310 (+) Transcript_22347:200-1129(+)